jgi:CheY-like chemotaxis protein
MTTILVVDDELLIAMALEAILDDVGYSIVTAANGRQGLERLVRKPHPGMLLFDKAFVAEVRSTC